MKSTARNPFKLNSLTALLILAAILVGGLFAAAGNGQAGGQQGSFDPNSPQNFIALMRDYLSVGERWVAMVSENESAAYLAIEGIIEIYERRGAKGEAIGHLRRLLDDRSTSPTVRTLLRFKLRDLYNETGQSDKALAELDRVLTDAS